MALEFSNVFQMNRGLLINRIYSCSLCFFQHRTRWTFRFDPAIKSTVQFPPLWEVPGVPYDLKFTTSCSLLLAFNISVAALTRLTEEKLKTQHGLHPFPWWEMRKIPLCPREEKPWLTSETWPAFCFLSEEWKFIEPVKRKREIWILPLCAAFEKWNANGANGHSKFRCRVHFFLFFFFFFFWLLSRSPTWRVSKEERDKFCFSWRNKRSARFIRFTSETKIRKCKRWRMFDLYTRRIFHSVLCRETEIRLLLRYLSSDLQASVPRSANWEYWNNTCKKFNWQVN